MRYCKVFLMLFLLVGVTGATIKHAYVPDEALMFGDPKHIYFDPKREVYVNANKFYDSWMFTLPEEKREALVRPFDIPTKKKYWVEFTVKPYRRPQVFYAHIALLSTLQQKKRVLLVNVEEATNPIHFKLYPHLGILYIGTVADREGWEVTLWDELIDGYVPLEKFVQPGDVVGLSLVVSGMERGILLAQKAKELGAAYVIAGNDSAIFRSDQLLALPGTPIDAVFTSNDLAPVRTFFREYDTDGFRVAPPGVARSNRKADLVAELTARSNVARLGQFEREGVFTVPNFNLYPPDYWERAWNNYRTVYGHKHHDPKNVRSAIGLLAQGCTRTQGTEACSYCTIYGVGDIRIPSEAYLKKTVRAYQNFGITNFFNATDSAYEMRPLVERLHNVDAAFEALTIYGRAQGIALHPELLDRWTALVSDRFLLNVGMDSGDENVLSTGVMKSSVRGKGSRLAENRAAVRNVRASGAHLHYSVIFGSPGESVASCERTIEFVEWTRGVLGPQLDLVESDIYWLNFGAPASEVFQSYKYAVKLAALVGHVITEREWYRDFGRHKDALVVPWSAEEAWYRHFTRIDIATAQHYNELVRDIMRSHEGSIRGRGFNPLRKEA